MKWTLALTLFTAAASATPIIPILPSDDVKVYTLRLQSRLKQLDGQTLGTRRGTIGLYRAPDAEAIRFFPVTDKKTGLVELHRYPIERSGGKETSQILALVGTNGLLTLSNVANPAAATFPTGTTCDWRSFKLAGGNPSAPGRPANALNYAGASGSWVAFPDTAPGDFTVKWKGANAFTTANDLPVDVVYEPFVEADANGDGVYTIQ